MSKRLILILAFAFVVGVACAAYAEVQNVKVSGDLTMMGVYRNNLDLRKERKVGTSPITGSDRDKNLLSIVRVRVDADLTDNVSTTVRLLNDRIWGSTTWAEADTHIDLDLAYATLKEFLYSPLSITVGRQELHYGNDMLVGASTTNNISLASNLPIDEQDLSMRKSFDAIRAVLDYDPLVVDLVFAKGRETLVAVNDDADLYGVNASYALDKATTIEGYAWAKLTGSNTTPVNAIVLPSNKGRDKVYTLGARVNNTTVKNLSVDLEAAFQFGEYNPQLYYNTSTTSAAVKDIYNRQAWALETMVNYDLKDISKISKYSPSVGALYAYFSGDNAAQKGDSKKWYGWDKMFENQTFGHLANVIFDQTNMHIAGINAKAKLMDDITLKFDYLGYWLAKAYRGGSYTLPAGNDIVQLKQAAGANTYYMTHNRHLGQEIDATLTYDYTEDVQFALLGGVFLPGTAFDKNNNPAISADGNRSAAAELIGSMKVTF